MALALVITHAGRAALRNADGSGTRAVRIAAVGFSPAALAPTATTAALPGEVKRITTVSGDAVAPDIIHLVVRDETMATYTVRSFALYLDDGTLFGAYGQADPIIEKSAQALLLLAVDVTLADITAGQITFGDANFLMPPATTERQGLIELATEAEAVAGTDRLRAVTPYTLRVTYGDVWRASNDGAGSGLDADLLDGRQGAEYALLSGAGFTGPIRAAGTIAARTTGGYVQLAPVTNASTGYVAFHGNDDVRRGYIGFAAPSGPIQLVSENSAGFAVTGGPLDVDAAVTIGAGGGGFVQLNPVANANTGFMSFLGADRVRRGYIGFAAPGGAIQLVSDNGGGFAVSGGPLAVSIAITRAGNAVWDAGNDGAGSGLDADLLDGRQGVEYALLSGASFTGPVRAAGPLTASSGAGYVQLSPTGNASSGFIGFHGADDVRRGYIGFAAPGGAIQLVSENGGGFAVSGGPLAASIAITRAGNAVWDAGNDGAGSGLDADLLDGQQGDWYRRWTNLLDVPGTFPPTGHTHGAADLAGAFPGNLSENGYTVLPNGLILQWATGAGMAAGEETTQLVYFPVAFPNACFGAAASTRDDYFAILSDVMFCTIGAPALDSVTVARKQFSERSSDRVPSRAFVIAIGR